jgi:hypothetical protein
MRFYNISIQTAAGKILNYSSLNSAGLNNGSALKVELDLYEALYHQAAPNSLLRIYGVPYADLSQLSNLNPNYTANPIVFPKIKIAVGMSAGLPYANPKQAGLIIDGIIEYAFANWQGTEICLDLIVNSIGTAKYARPNIAWNWGFGQNMQLAITNALKTGYPDAIVTGSISSTLKYTETQPGVYTDIATFSKYLNKTSKDINPDPNYIGVTVCATPDGFAIDDGTALSNQLIKIDYVDMIGNPTWKAPGVIQTKLTMRGDINLNDYITFPPLTNAVNNAFSTQQVRNTIPFQGYFQAQLIRHVGSSRQATGDSWCTVVDCVVTNNIPSSITGK